MAWTVYGTPLMTADATAATYYQRIVPTDFDVILTAVRTYIVVLNNPTYTSLNMKLYSNASGVPRSIIATSTNSQLKADISTLDNAIKEIYFEFDSVVLKKNTVYHLVLNAAGYTGDDSSHVAWKQSFPDPAYQSNVDMSFEGLVVSPYDVTLYGAKL